MIAVAFAIKDAHGVPIKPTEFERAATERDDVKTALAAARDALTQGAIAQGTKKYDLAVANYKKSIDLYASVGAEVWRTEELAYAWIHLGIACTLRDAAKPGPSADATTAVRTARI